MVLVTYHHEELANRKMNKLPNMPQWTTSARLLKLGEAIDFRFFLPAGASSGEFRTFPKVLERAEPGDKFRADGGLGWVVMRFSGMAAVIDVHSSFLLRLEITHIRLSPRGYRGSSCLLGWLVWLPGRCKG